MVEFGVEGAGADKDGFEGKGEARQAVEKKIGAFDRLKAADIADDKIGGFEVEAFSEFGEVRAFGFGEVDGI